MPTTLFGKDAFKRIVLFVTDGDKQLSSQLDVATEKYFPNTYHGRCMWHILDQGMKSDFPNAETRLSSNSIHNPYRKARGTRLQIESIMHI